MEVDNYMEWLVDTLNRMEKALKIYADPTSYITEINGTEITPTVMKDKGEVARQALGATNENT